MASSSCDSSSNASSMTHPCTSLHTGVAFFYAGMVRHKNVVATMVQALVSRS
jgi:ammonia channel protein AmtB